MPDKNYSPSMSNLLTVDDDDIVFFPIHNSKFRAHEATNGRNNI